MANSTATHENSPRPELRMTSKAFSELLGQFTPIDAELCV
jgi:hypothetical protein